MKAQNRISSFLSFLAFLLFPILLAGCAADDLQWGGQVNTEEEIAISFAPSDMMEIAVGSRADNLPSTDVEDAWLIIFNEDNKLTYGKNFNKNEFISLGSSSGANAVKIKRSHAAKGTWYVVANGKSIIDAILPLDPDGDPTGEMSLADFEDNTLSLPQVTGEANDNKALLIAKREVSSIPSATDPVMPAFTLQRRFAKISFAMGKGVEFHPTGIALFRAPSQVKIGGNAVLPLDPMSDYHEDGFITLPVPHKMGEEETYPEARLIIKGYTPTGRDADDKPIYDNAPETFFAYKFPGAIESDHEYSLTLKSVVGEGYADAEAAASNPVGAVIEYADSYAASRNIVTDGERVIALPDTLRPAAGDTKVEFDIVWRGKASDELLHYSPGGDELILENSLIDSSWLTKIEASSPVDISSEDGSLGDSDFKRFRTHFTLTLTENEGSEREAKLCFRLKESEILLPVLTICQKAPENINLDESIDINLTIKRGTTQTLNVNYLVFVDNNPADGVKTKGITPDKNGGRIRNAGLHFPMSNGGNVTYTYTISGLDGWSLTYGKNVPTSLKATPQSNGSYVFSFKDNEYPDIKNYDVYEDAIILTKGGKTLTLDIYHTGFFYPLENRWYYYEVFTAGGCQWLDRNIGASSAGMAHLEESYVGGSEWPMREESAGASFSLTDAKKDDGSITPPGWHLPTQGDFEMMAMQSGFSSDRYTTGGRTIFLPAYTFAANIYPKEGAATRSSLRAFFPHNKYIDGGAAAGDNGAGYYWTDTNTDNDRYYRCIKFVGQNVTPENMLTTRRLSLRCMAGEGGDNSTVTYTCQVKGYTHVFLYAEKNGVKTYLNTWPGTQVAIPEMKDKRFNPFSYSSFIDYIAEGYSLYIIFNNPSSDGTVSNVTPEAAKSRQGIPFILANGTVNHNGEGYDSSLSKMSYTWGGKDIVLTGNWQKTTATTYQYALKGNFNGKSWDPSKAEEFSETASGTNIWSLDLDVSTAGEFVIMRKKTTQSGWTNDNDWGKTDPAMDVKLNEPMTVATGLGNDHNWKFTSTGKYKLTLDINNMTLTVTKEGGGNYYQLLSGEPGSTGIKLDYEESTGLWIFNEYDLSKSFYFVIQERKSDGSWVKTFRPASEETIKYGEVIETTNTGSKFFKSPVSTDKDKVFMAFDPVKATLTVVRTEVTGWWVNVPGDHNEWGDNGQQPDRFGITIHENLSLGSNGGGFKIKIWNGEVLWYSTGGEVETGKWVSVGANDANMTVKSAKASDKYTVEFNCETNKMRITKVNPQSIRKKGVKRGRR